MQWIVAPARLKEGGKMMHDMLSDISSRRGGSNAAAHEMGYIYMSHWVWLRPGCVEHRWKSVIKWGIGMHTVQHSWEAFGSLQTPGP
jgi:hypothetical protein